MTRLAERHGAGAGSASAEDAGDCLRSVRLGPEPSEWIARTRHGSLDARARRFREQLGLPTDRTVFFSGHQAEFWHPGILAKGFALDAARASWGVHAAWLVVDQDANDALAIRYPAATPTGSFESRTWRPGETRTGVAVGGLDAISPPSPPSPPRDVAIPDFVRGGLDRIARALAEAAGEATLAAQIGESLRRLLAEQMEPPHLIYATSIAGTDLFADLIERMRADPVACVRAYNDAVARHPQVGIRPLGFPDDPRRVELPVWRLRAGERRSAVTAGDLAGLEARSLAPRALLMTGIMRLAGADLFIHGTGGAGHDGTGGYDLITDHWFEAWLGERPPAPVTLATATLLLPLTDGPLPCADSAQRQIALAHRARHAPGLVGDEQRERTRRELVRRIERAPRRSAERRELFDRLHDLLADHRARNAEPLQELDDRAAEARRALAGESVLCERAWPFPLYPPELLGRLRDRIARGFPGPRP